jgi:DNA topoisomerase-2
VHTLCRVTDIHMHAENMHAFNAAGKITKYANAEQVSAEHFTLRWDAYVRRKDALERKYAYEVALSGSKSRFIADILNGDLAVVKPTGGAVQLSELRAELNRRGFVPLEELRRQHLLEVDGGDEKQFSYLLGLPIQSLTEERAQALSAQAVEAAARLEALRARSIEMLWMDDIAALETALAREASPRQVKPKKIL